MFTKASLLEGPGRTVVHNLKRDSILREAQASLERLGVDAIDLYQIHWPIPDAGHRGGLVGARRAQGAGPRAPHRRLELRRRAAAARSSRSPRSRRCSRQYSLIERERRAGDPPVRRARADIGVIVYSPMGSGLLTGGMTRERIAALADDDWRKHDPRFHEPQLSRNLALVDAPAPWSPSATTPRRGRSRSRGRCATPPSTARSSASAGPTRSTRSSPPPTSS